MSAEPTVGRVPEWNLGDRMRKALTEADVSVQEIADSRHRTHECRHTWQTKGPTFMGIRVITKWCPCDGYRDKEDQ